MRHLVTTLSTAVLAIGCGGDPDARSPGTSIGSESGPSGEGDTSSMGSSDDGVDASGSESADTGEPGGSHRIELVGHSLADHPQFRVVQDFNDDESVEIAIDPAQVPALAGRECDAWVVMAKTADEWIGDPQLVDVRGAPQLVAIGGELASNRFVLAAPGALSSDAGPSLGVAFDVVLDCNRNAAFDEGDVIDGGDAPGFYRTHDTTVAGPLAVSMFEAYASQFLDQRTFHPTEIAAMDELPLVVVTHGWSYNHTYYDYIGEHLASYGYIVMFHEADVMDGDGAGTIAAANTTLENLDDLLANQSILGGGVLDGHIDARRIMLTGHSTGGEAVVRAATQLREGSFASAHFGYDDIRVVSSMAPVSWHPRTMVDPGDLNYHMFVAGADADVSGAPELSYTQCRSIYERAVGNRQLTYIHGAGHGDLLGCCGELFLDTSAPGLIGRAETNRVARGYFLALAELYLRENPAAEEFFTRSYADFHPVGIAANVVVTGEFRAARTGAVVLDDFESGAGLDQSSSGGAVTFDVANAAEVLMQDNDGSFAWTGNQPSNGMTHARHEGDDPHALVFDWNSTVFYEQAVVEALQDFSAYEFLSFRAAQGTRHPETVALGGPLSFTVTLRDADGESGSVKLEGVIGAPYARGGYGAGTGWGNELVTVRVRIAELAIRSAVDLSRIATVRLEFGGDSGSAHGRMALDDLELVAR